MSSVSVLRRCDLACELLGGRGRGGDGGTKAALDSARAGGPSQRNGSSWSGWVEGPVEGGQFFASGRKLSEKRAHNKGGARKRGKKGRRRESEGGTESGSVGSGQRAAQGPGEALDVPGLREKGTVRS